MINFHIGKDGDQFHAWCSELKGCHTFGKTEAEALENLKDAMKLYLEDELESQTMKQVAKI